MSLADIKALTFHTGGTILDWHTGFKTVFVRRPDEWGNESPPAPDPNPQHDIIVESFPELAEALKAS